MAIWLLGWGSVFLFNLAVPVSRHEALGQTGDMFGAANALFSGLGFAGILIVLIWDAGQRKQDLIDRRHARRPFLVPRAAHDDATRSRKQSQVARAKWDGTRFDFVLGIHLRIENLTAEPALNVEVRAQLVGAADATDSQTLGLPVDAKNDEYLELRLAAHDGAQAQTLARKLKEDPVGVQIDVSYQSLEGVTWVSTAQFEITAVGRNIARSLDREQNDYIDISDEKENGTPTNQTPFQLQAKPGSWKQYVRD